MDLTLLIVLAAALLLVGECHYSVLQVLLLGSRLVQNVTFHFILKSSDHKVFAIFFIREGLKVPVRFIGGIECGGVFSPSLLLGVKYVIL